MSLRPALLALLLVRGSCAADQDANPIAPETAPTTAVDLDPDGDTILGAHDRCPDEPGLPADGCPLRDADHDGVLDPDDACPDQRECINGFDDLDGCPDTLPEELGAILGVLPDLGFTPNKWDIPAKSFPILDHVAEVLARYPHIELEIAGHIDVESEQTRRRQPSQHRAQAVRDYLIHAGIDPERLQAVGYGEERPIASNESAEGRAANRRVELHAIHPPWGDACPVDPSERPR